MKPVQFPHAAQLFKFCHKVLNDTQNSKVNDQAVGALINFNPSDCSHWKKGEKNVRSVFALESLARQLGVEITLIHDLSSGVIGLDEAYYEHHESKSFQVAYQKAANQGLHAINQCRFNVRAFVDKLHQQANFITPPLYLPEVMRYLPFVQTQPADIRDRLSRVLRVKPHHYIVQSKKGELKAQTRMSLMADVARIIFEGERNRYQELGAVHQDLLAFERHTFVASVLAPHELLRKELSKIDVRKNALAELSSLFWAPKSLIGYQIQELIRQTSDVRTTPYLPTSSVKSPSNKFDGIL